MSDANKAVVKRWIESIAAGDVATYRECYADDGVHEVPGTCFFSGVFAADQAAAAIAAVSSVTKNGLTMHILRLTAEDDRVSAEVRGEAELQTGASYNNLYHFLFTLRDGKFSNVKEFLDTKLVEDVFKPAWDARTQRSEDDVDA